MEYMGREKLLSYIRDDIDEAFNSIVDEFGSRILRIAYLELNNFSDSEEILQEVLLKLYRNINSFKGDSSIYTWIYRITINTCKSYKKSKKEHLSLEEINILDIESHENEIIDKLRNVELFEVLNKLEFKYRRVLFLYYYEELKIKEISEILGKREGTIKTWLTRGKKYLQRELLKEGEYNE